MKLAPAEEEAHQSQRLQSLGQLAGGVAHDFNNLLAVILGYATHVHDVLAARGDELCEPVEEIVRAAEHAADLTRQLLVFTRRRELGTSVFDLAEAVTSGERLLRRTLAAAVELNVSLPDQPLPVELGAGQIQQVLVNLAMNGRDAMPAGGRLTIEARVVDEGAFVELTVYDTGTGMAPEVAAHAFDPFFTTKESGTGLGLSTVQGIASRAGGDVRIDTEPEAGTAVTVRLPLSATAPETPERRGGRRRGVPTGEHAGRILLVEDDPGVRTLIALMLGEAGYSVVQASGPAEALALRHTAGQVDLLLTDMLLPGMRGDELARTLVGLDPGLRVLYVTGQDAGEAGRLQKPFTSEQLVDAVREALA